MPVFPDPTHPPGIQKKEDPPAHVSVGIVVVEGLDA